MLHLQEFLIFIFWKLPGRFIVEATFEISYYKSPLRFDEQRNLFV